MIKTTSDTMVKALSGIANDNVSIADVVIDRKKLLECLKLYPESVIKIDYGSITWFDNTSEYKDRAYFKTTIDNESCIQIRIDNQIIRFLNRGKKTKYGNSLCEITPLNFTELIVKQDITGVSISVKALLEALNFTSINVASEQSRPALNCVMFESDGNTLKLIAADGFRLGVSSLNVNTGINKALIPLDGINKLVKFLRMLKPSGKGKNKVLPDVSFEFTDKGIKLTSGDRLLELEKFDGKFPDYPALIPTQGTKIEFTASDMAQAVKALQSIAKDGSGIIRLMFYAGNPGRIVLTSHSEDFGDSIVECDAIVESDCRIACNVQYLSELMRQLGDSKVSLRITTVSSPLLFEVGNFTSVIMPMAVQWEQKPEDVPASIPTPETPIYNPETNQVEDVIEASNIITG